MKHKKEYWYTLVHWENGEEQVVGNVKAILYHKKEDAIKAFKEYPKRQTSRGYLEGWKIKRVLV